jgi:iron-sulfur cluster repair protein YtfE (RIC family)
MSDTTTAAPMIGPETTVNEAIRRFPATVDVFNRFGIHSCCGGYAPIAEAAERDGADGDALLAALREVVEDGR